jgi:hypothetical protein
MAPRGGGPVQLILGLDNGQLFPDLASVETGSEYNLAMYKTRIKGGMIYGGFVAPGQWSCLVSATYGSALVMIFLVALFLSLPAPVDAFLGYDCANGTNPVEAYSLLEPAHCTMTGEDHRFERLIQAEIVQQKRERSINVFRFLSVLWALQRSGSNQVPQV